ncbi:hypothetical protein PENTCL1PPCAC_15140, partial [Pristionchus entomophagus]
MRYAIPYEQLRNELVKSIFELHGTDLRHYHMAQFSVVFQNGIDLVDIMLYEAMPSYIGCYGLFVFSALRIRSRLSAIGSFASKNTVQMHRRFFLIQIAQVM